MFSTCPENCVRTRSFSFSLRFFVQLLMLVFTTGFYFQCMRPFFLAFFQLVAANAARNDQLQRRGEKDSGRNLRQECLRQSYSTVGSQWNRFVQFIGGQKGGFGGFPPRPAYYSKYWYQKIKYYSRHQLQATFGLIKRLVLLSRGMSCYLIKCPEKIGHINWGY